MLLQPDALKMWESLYRKTLVDQVARAVMDHWLLTSQGLILLQARRGGGSLPSINSGLAVTRSWAKCLLRDSRWTEVARCREQVKSPFETSG